MPFQYILCLAVGLGTAFLLWMLRSKTRQYDRLQADFESLQKNYAWVSSSIDKALLFVEGQDIVWMNDAAQHLFGSQVPRPLASIFYRNETANHIPSEDSIKCLCLGINDYLFPASLHIQHDPHSSRCMILMGDENFQERPTASLVDLQHDLLSEETEAQEAYSSIVIIDDDHAVLETYSDMISFEGWTVHSFTSAPLAIQYIQKNSDSISLIITDYQLRELTGVELLKQIQQFAPHLKGLVISGFNLSDPIYEELPFLQKPCTRSTLITTIEKMLKSPS